MLCLEFVPGVAEMVSKDETHELWRPPKYKKLPCQVGNLIFKTTLC